MAAKPEEVEFVFKCEVCHKEKKKTKLGFAQPKAPRCLRHGAMKLDRSTVKKK